MQSLVQMKIVPQARPASSEAGIARLRYTYVPNCVRREGLASWDGAERQKKGVRGKFEGLCHRETFAGGRAR